MIPAAAVVATIGTTPAPPAASAAAARRGVSRYSRVPKLAAQATAVDQNTARNAVTPATIITVIAASDEKWNQPPRVTALNGRVPTATGLRSNRLESASTV